MRLLTLAAGAALSGCAAPPDPGGPQGEADDIVAIEATLWCNSAPTVMIAVLDSSAGGPQLEATWTFSGAAADWGDSTRSGRVALSAEEWEALVGLVARYDLVGWSPPTPGPIMYDDGCAASFLFEGHGWAGRTGLAGPDPLKYPGFGHLWEELVRLALAHALGDVIGLTQVPRSSTGTAGATPIADGRALPG